MNRSALRAALGDAAVRALLVAAPSSTATALHQAWSARAIALVVVPDVGAAVRLLSEDVEGFDLLVVISDSAGEDTALLVRTVRRGGESELAVVVVGAGASAIADLERAGADAVLDRSLGVALIVRASEAVLSRKRVKGR